MRTSCYFGIAPWPTDGQTSTQVGRGWLRSSSLNSIRSGRRCSTLCIPAKQLCQGSGSPHNEWSRTTESSSWYSHLLWGLKPRGVRRRWPRVVGNCEWNGFDHGIGSIVRPVHPYTRDWGQSSLTRARWRCLRRGRTLGKSGRAIFGKAGTQSTPAASL